MSDDGFEDDDGFDDGDDDWGEDGGEDEWGDDGGDFGDQDVEDGDLGWEVQVDNALVEGDMLRKSDPQAALEKFELCVSLEEENDAERGTKRFQALRHIVLINIDLGKMDVTVDKYTKLLEFGDRVTPMELTTAIRGILAAATRADAEAAAGGPLMMLYAITLQFLEAKSGNRDVWFEFAMRLCRMYIKTGQIGEAQPLVDRIHGKCKSQGDPTQDDESLGSFLVQVYAVRIEIAMARGETRAIPELVEKATQLSVGVSDPRSTGIIKECLGRLQASSNNWAVAYNEFFAAFTNMQNCGEGLSARRNLKYAVVSSMLVDAADAVNPFASGEARALETDALIWPIKALFDSFERDDVRGFERLLGTQQEAIMGDDQFLKDNMEGVKRTLRSRLIVKMVKPYSRVKLDWLCRALNVELPVAESLVVNLILSGQIKGKLDQVHNLLALQQRTDQDSLCDALEKWMVSVRAMGNQLAARSASSSGAMRRGMGGYGAMFDFGMEDDFYDGMDDRMFGGMGGLFGMGGAWM